MDTQLFQTHSNRFFSNPRCNSAASSISSWTQQTVQLRARVCALSQAGSFKASLAASTKAVERRYTQTHCSARETTRHCYSHSERRLTRDERTAVHVMQCLGQLDTPLKKFFHAWIHIATAHPVFLLPYYGLCKRSIAMCVS